MILRWLDKTTLPVEADGLSPEGLLDRSPEEIAKAPVRVGNQNAELGDLFSIQSDDSRLLTIEGDLRAIYGIGRKMRSGSLIIRGMAGPYLGAEMTGGEIEVFGDVGDWAGVGMQGGLLRVRGNAGRRLGASEPGARLGMEEGVIVVEGNAGEDVGSKMRRGWIVVGGDVAEGCGKGMVAGSIFVFGQIGRFAGMGMKRGTIASFGADSVELLPSFAGTGRFRFPFMHIYLKRLEELGFPVPDEVFSSPLSRYNGDLTENGRGEILVRSDSLRKVSWA